MAGLDIFIKLTKLDERAVEALRAADPSVQEAVINRGDLSDCRNPSSVVIARIGEAKNKEKQGSSPQVDVEEFVSSQGLDEKAAECLRGSSGDVQKAVMEKGDLSDCRNPSAVILCRIRDATKRGIGGSWSGGGAKAKQEEVVAFIVENALDERASEALRTCTPEVQHIVLDRGALQEARNPSAVVLGRIKAAQTSGGGGKGGGFGGSMMSMMMGGMKGGMGKGCGGGFGGFGGGFGGGWGGDSYGGMGNGSGLLCVERLIAENNLDDRAAEQLRSLGANVQQEVMARGGGGGGGAKKGGGRSFPY